MIENRSIYNIRVSIPQKYHDRVVFKSGVTIFLDTHFNHEEKVVNSGIVTFVPKAGVLAKAGIEVGDEVYFDYRVISEGDMLPGYGRVHTNAIDINGKEEFYVAPYNILGVDKGNGIVPYGKYVFATGITRPAFTSSLIITPENYSGETDAEQKDHIKLTAVSDKVNTVSAGETVWVKHSENRPTVMSYSFTGDTKDITLIVNADYIIAKDMAA